MGPGAELVCTRIYRDSLNSRGHAMRSVLARQFLFVLCCSFAVSAASAADAIRYVSCRADNDSDASTFAIDETAKKVCDRDFSDAWIAPLIFDGTEIEWSDGLSTKAIYLKGKNKRYEHDIFILVHVGHCKKVKAPTAELCKG
jgi:hypothetical protein